VVTQREIGIHAPSFSEALRHALREDPDVILLGELRDVETIALALTAAETGIQVLGTLHTSGATRTVDRIVNVFPARRQDQIRSMLADSLRLIVSQQLVRRADGSERVLVAEVLVNTHAASTMIRTGNAHKLGRAERHAEPGRHAQGPGPPPDHRGRRGLRARARQGSFRAPHGRARSGLREEIP
jgi:twitching motility protein PilT